MAGRYYLTGVQMGLLMRIKDESKKIKILQKIMDEQFIGNFESGAWNRIMKPKQSWAEVMVKGGRK